MDQVRAVVPLALYLALFQILFLRYMVEDSWVITGGLFAVIAGLMFFMEGLQLGLMPFGPVTVPLVLSLGIGIAAAAGKGDSGLSGFGIVTLASLFPIIGVLLLCLYVSYTVTPDEIIAAASQAAAAAQAVEPAWYERSPGQEVALGVRAILPLVLFLLVVLRLVLKEKLDRQGEIVYGIVLAIIGMCIFNLGLTYGLSRLGANAGGLVPAAFMEVSGMPASPQAG